MLAKRTMRLILVGCLIGGLTLESFGQVTTQVCRGQICVTLPPVSPPTLTPITTPVPAATLKPASAPNHTKAIVLTAAVSAAGTWALVKLFKRKKAH